MKLVLAAVLSFSASVTAAGNTAPALICVESVSKQLVDLAWVKGTTDPYDYVSQPFSIPSAQNTAFLARASVNRVDNKLTHVSLSIQNSHHQGVFSLTAESLDGAESLGVQYAGEYELSFECALD